MTLWEILDIEIKKSGMSIYQLTKQSGLSVNSLYHLKNGRTNDISFLNMCAIADVLNVSLDIFRLNEGV